MAPQEPVQLDPAWSPDGNSIIFGEAPLGQLGTLHTAGLHVVDLKTRQTPGSEGLWAPPRVSPNGRWVVGLSADTSQLILFDLMTHETIELAKGISSGWPEWSRDSQYMYFLLSRSNSAPPGLFRVRIGDRKLEEIESVKDTWLAGGVFGPWYGLAPDDSPLMLRDAATQEIYGLDWEE